MLGPQGEGLRERQRGRGREREIGGGEREKGSEIKNGGGREGQKDRQT